MGPLVLSERSRHLVIRLLHQSATLTGSWTAASHITEAPYGEGDEPHHCNLASHRYGRSSWERAWSICIGSRGQ